MLWWILIVTFAIYLYKRCRQHYQYWKNLNIPYVDCPPVLGNMASFLFRQKSLPELVQDIYNSHNGRYIGMFLFDQPTLMIKDLDLIKQIGIKDFDHFVNRKSVIYEKLDPVIGRCVASLSGENWKNLRSKISPAFTSSRMRHMFELINKNSEQFTIYFMKQVEANATQKVELKDMYSRFACDMIASIAFGINCDSMENKDNKFYRMTKAVTTFNPTRTAKFLSCMVSMPIVKFLKLSIVEDEASDFFRNLLINSMETRERGGNMRPDMINLLTETRKQKLKDNNEDSNELDDALSALIFYLAGFDSISTVLSFTCSELALNRNVQDKLQAEIDATLQECEGTLTYDIITNMKYLDMVISESMRKWPPRVVPDRICTKPYIIQPENENEVPVPINNFDRIWIPVYAIHRDPQYYPNPEKFDPERFNDVNKANIPQNAYMPFGLGPRNCIGSRFALVETKTLLVHLLSKFTFEALQETQVALKPGKWQFNLQSSTGYWVGIKSRF